MATWLSSRTTDPLSLRRPSCHRGLVGGTWCPCDGIQLGTDGVWAQGQEGPGQQHQGTGSPWAQTLFVGGLPVGGFSARIPAAMGDSGISGCARRLRLDRWPLGTLTWVVGVTPCFSGPLEKGLFFAGRGELSF